MPEMSTATGTPVVLQISPFDNYEGCTKKLPKEVGKYVGARLLMVDCANGIFTISTVEHPEVIRAALQRAFRDKSVTLCGNHQGGTSYREMSQVMMAFAQSERIRNVEWTQDGLRVSFYEIRPSAVENVRARVEYVPPLPSAPSQDYVYGQPVGFYGHSPIIEDDRQICTIL